LRSASAPAASSRAGRTANRSTRRKTSYTGEQLQTVLSAVARVGPVLFVCVCCYWWDIGRIYDGILLYTRTCQIISCAHTRGVCEGASSRLNGVIRSLARYSSRPFQLVESGLQTDFLARGLLQVRRISPRKWPSTGTRQIGHCLCPPGSCLMKLAKHGWHRHAWPQGDNRTSRGADRHKSKDCDRSALVLDQGPHADSHSPQRVHSREVQLAHRLGSSCLAWRGLPIPPYVSCLCLF